MNHPSDTTIITAGRFSGSVRSYERLEDVADLSTFKGALDIDSDTDPATLIPYLENITALRIAFPSSADGRGNSIAKRLRSEGFDGPIRAFGHIHPDQYPLALRNGFTDIEIDATLAERQPEHLWADTLNRVAQNYLSRLKSGAMRPALQTPQAA